MMAVDNDAILSPVGQVWHYIRDNHPEIELYNADMSHPSSAGTYAAAITFYSLLFQKDPNSIVYNGTLSSTDATAIKNAAQAVVYDSLAVWHVYEYLPLAAYAYNTTMDYVEFTNISQQSSTYLWKFGDGSESTEINPTHTYSSAGNYDVTLYASACGITDSTTQTILIQQLGLNDLSDNSFQVTLQTNPVEAELIFHVNKYENITLEIYNLLGVKMRNLPVSGNDVTIAIPELQTGNYFLIFKDEHQTILNTTGFIKL